MKQVAELAGVSTATVSRVLNGNTTTSREVVERVTAAMRELDYRPNRIARSLRKTSTETLAVLVSNVANPFFAELVRSIEDRALDSGMGLILGNASEMAERQESYLRAFIEQQIAGLIITPTGADASWVEGFQARGIPVVFVDRVIPDVDVPSVTTDHDAALDELVAHLVALGHRSASIVTGIPTNSPTRLRVEGFLRAAERHGLEVPADRILSGGTTADGGRAQAARLLEGSRTDVLFTTNNVMALGALHAMADAGLEAARDLAFASYDDTPWFEVMSPPVTSIAQPVSQLGVEAVDLLRRIREGGDSSSIRLPSRFVARRSCGEAD